MHLATAGLLLIRDRKLLMAFSKNKKCFYLPGGKVMVGETAGEALVRECREELCIELEPSRLHWHSHISAPAFGEAGGTVMEQDCFLPEVDLTPVPGAEIGELRFFSLAEYLEQEVKAPGAIMILQLLKQENRID